MMLSQALEGFLLGINATQVTEFFLWLLVGAFISAVVCQRLGLWQRFTAYAPTLLTSLGILGTFVGIVVGLLGFDPTHIDTSIAQLLAGLKTAFITSLAGMGASIAFRFLCATPVLGSLQNNDVGATPEDVLTAIREQTGLLEATRNAIAGGEESSLAGQLKLMRTDVHDQTRILDQTRRAIAGEEDASLTGQVKLMRADMDARAKAERAERDAFAEALWKQMNEFAEMLSKSATEQVIEALRQVIVDFNKNLTEQFGENFRALDASVQKLVEWQKEYRQQLINLHQLYDAAVTGTQQIEQSMRQVAGSTEAIPQHMEKLDAIVTTAQQQLAELERHLEAFRDMRDKAVEAVPMFQKHAEEMTTDITASVKTASEHYSKLLDLSDNYVEAQNELAQGMLGRLTSAGEAIERDTQAIQARVSESIDRMSSGLQETVTKAFEAHQSASSQLNDGVNQMRTNLENALNEVVQAQNRASSQVVETIREHTSQSVSRAEEAINKELQGFDKAMQAELTRVMNEMGRAMAQITSHMVTEYERMAKVASRIEMAGGDVR